MNAKRGALVGHLFLITSLRAPKGRGNPDLIYFSSFSAASFLAIMCTFALRKYQMLGSVISMQAWLRLSSYAFALRATPFGSDIRKKFSCIARLAGVCPVEKLLQVLKGCFILGNNFSLRSELGAFGGVTVAN